MGTIRIGGVNYQPQTSRQVDLATGTLGAESAPVQGSISTLHLEMRLRVDIGGQEIDLLSPLANCGSSCRDEAGEVEILRFAKDGITPLPGIDGPGLQWLVTMEEGAFMSGTVDTDALEAGDPADFTLRGRMMLQYQLSPGDEVVRLLSRAEPLFQGTTTEWPPRGCQLSLSNAPIEYFREDDVDRPNAQPALRILSNDVIFGQDEVSLLTVRPEITSASYVGPGGTPWVSGTTPAGVSLSWTDTRSLVSPSDPPVRYYHVYRRFAGDTLNGWVRIRSLPADVTTFIDTTATGNVNVEYVVVHAAEYPFGHRYESLMGPTVVLPAAATLPPAEGNEDEPSDEIAG